MEKEGCEQSLLLAAVIYVSLWLSVLRVDGFVFPDP